MKKHLKGIKEALIRSHFLKNIISLTSGTAAAQFLPLLALPALSRIYSPEAYGALALFTGLSLILVPIFSFEYAQGILYAKSKRDALRLLFCSNFIGLFSLIISLLIIGIAYCTSLLSKENVIFLLIPFSTYFQSLILLFINFFNRISRFSIVSVGKVSNAACNIIFSFTLAYFSYSSHGLIIAYFIAQLLTVIFFLFKFYKTGFRISLSRLIRVNTSILKKYKEYPMLILPSSFINVLINHIPVYILSYYYNAATVGYFHRSRQVLSIPIAQIASSIGDVFKQEANRRYIKGESNLNLFINTGKWLLFLSLPFLFVIFFYGPELFSLAFGDEWITAGKYSQILIFLFVLRFINTPLGSLYFIMEKYSEALIMNLLLLILITSFLFITSSQNSSIESVLIYYTIGYSLSYIIGILRAYQFSEKIKLKQEITS